MKGYSRKNQHLYSRKHKGCMTCWDEYQECAHHLSFTSFMASLVHSLTSLQMGIRGCLRHTTHVHAHTHPCGKTKSHRVCMYMHNSHAFLLMLNKPHWLFWKIILSKPKQILITEKPQTLELILHSCLVKYTNLVLVSFLRKTEILKGFLTWFTFMK